MSRDTVSPLSYRLSLLERDLAAEESRLDSLFLAAKYNEALEIAIGAIECCINARQQAADADKLWLDKRSQKLIGKAEWIKKLREKAGKRTKDVLNNGINVPPPLDSLRGVALGGTPRVPPVPTRKLTVKEETLLLKSSRVNGHVFPPWGSDPKPSEFFPDGPFSDPSGLLPLSDSQRSMLAAWKRPDEIYENRQVIYPGGGYSLDLMQDVVTDCSVVASLCSAVGREEKGFGKIISSILYPQSADGTPINSPLGKYIVKLYFNGCFRKVILDDYLPVSNNSRALYVTCRHDPRVFYPALIEKAYLKLMGGYDFPGSNSGTDLLALTGWIPEHVFLQSDDVLPGNFWRRIYKAWGYGDVLVTLGTGSMTKREELELGLIGEHDYAVLALKEENGQGMLQVKNPWSEGTVWKGAPAPDSDEEGEDFDARSGESTFDTGELHGSLPPAAGEAPSPGVFWISQDNVFRHFASVYLNWNPTLFTQRNDTHFSWDCSGKKSENFVGGNPQFSLENPSSKPALVWLLLGRHMNSTGCYKSQGGASNQQRSYISLCVFESPGRRVYRSGSALHTGPYVDSPQTLLKVDTLPPRTKYTVAISSQDLPRTEHTFTLSVLSLTPLRITEADDPYSFRHALQSQWLPETAGGNAQSPTYSTNPQFRLSVPSSCDALLFLETIDSISAHVKLVWGNGKRITTVTTRDIIAESGEYRRGHALAEAISLQKGQYTIVASTFEAGHVGDFTLTVGTTAPGAVFQQLPSESAGKLRKTVEGAWDSGVRVMAYPLSVERFTRVSVSARTLWANTRAQPMLKVSVERGVGDSKRETEATSGFSDAPQGVRTGDVDLESGLDYLVVLERLGDEDGSRYVLEVLSDGAAHLGSPTPI